MKRSRTENAHVGTAHVGVWLLLSLLTACQPNRDVTVSPATDQATTPPRPIEEVLIEHFVGVPGMENVIQTEPAPNEVDVPVTTAIAALFRRPIRTADEELGEAVEVFDKDRMQIAGTLYSTRDRQQLVFCPKEPLGTSQRYTVRFTSLVLTDEAPAGAPGSVPAEVTVPAFTITFETASSTRNASDSDPPCSSLSLQNYLQLP